MGKGECETTMLSTKLNCSEVKVSVPGKVILHGEHSVVYGKLAIAASIGLKTIITLKELSTDVPMLVLTSPQINLDITFSISEVTDVILRNGIPLKQCSQVYNFQNPDCLDQEALVKRIEYFLENKKLDSDIQRTSLITLFYLYCAILYPSGIPLSALHIDVTTQLSIGAGMGSSASFAVSLVAALFEYIKNKYKTYPIFAQETYQILVKGKNKIFEDEELHLISNWAYHAEKITHGDPSGIDNTTCTFGSIVEFRKGTKPIPLCIHHKLRCLLIDTLVPRNTKILVGKVANLKLRFPNIVENTLSSMEEISKMAIDCLKKLSNLNVKQNQMIKEDYQAHYNLLEELVDMNQNMLRILGVSHPTIDEICAILALHGLHGKITGAGGGGYVLAVVPFYYEEENLVKVQEALKQHKYQVNVLDLGGDGITVL